MLLSLVTYTYSILGGCLTAYPSHLEQPCSFLGLLQVYGFGHDPFHVLEMDVRVDFPECRI
jgi:hypothetical protein